MPINTVQVYLQKLLNGMEFPIANVPALQAQITPPDPQVDSEIPQAYIWPARGRESRDPQFGGTVNRATSFGAPSGLKSMYHRVNLYLVWFGQDDDPDSDTLFPGMVDAILSTLRSSPNPTPLQTDVWSGIQSYLIDVGEKMDYEVTLRALVDQRFNRYDALLTLEIDEVFPS